MSVFAPHISQSYLGRAPFLICGDRGARTLVRTTDIFSVQELPDGRVRLTVEEWDGQAPVVVVVQATFDEVLATWGFDLTRSYSRPRPPRRRSKGLQLASAAGK